MCTKTSPTKRPVTHPLVSHEGEGLFPKWIRFINCATKSQFQGRNLLRNGKIGDLCAYIMQINYRYPLICPEKGERVQNWSKRKPYHLWAREELLPVTYSQELDFQWSQRRSPHFSVPYYETENLSSWEECIFTVNLDCRLPEAPGKCVCCLALQASRAGRISEERLRTQKGSQREVPRHEGSDEDSSGQQHWAGGKSPMCLSFDIQSRLFL